MVASVYFALWSQGPGPWPGARWGGRGKKAQRTVPGRSRGSRWLRQGQSAPRADPSVLPLGLEPPRPLEAGSQRVVLTAVALGAPRGIRGSLCPDARVSATCRTSERRSEPPLGLRPLLLRQGRPHLAQAESVWGGHRERQVGLTPWTQLLADARGRGSALGSIRAHDSGPFARSLLAPALTQVWGSSPGACVPTWPRAVRARRASPILLPSLLCTGHSTRWGVPESPDRMCPGLGDLHPSRWGCPGPPSPGRTELP